MPYLFDHLELIEGLLRQSPFGLFTDVDGTISRTTPTPQQAQVSPSCHYYLSLLCPHLALVAAISGRPAATVRNMVGIDGMIYIGNHGLERWIEGRAESPGEAKHYSEIIKAVSEELEQPLSMEGISIENKGLTASVHYRLSPEPERAKRAILNTIRKAPLAGQLRTIEGKKIIDILPKGAANKGTAILELIQRYALRGGIYLGDDATDIDAFRAIRTVPRMRTFADWLSA